MKKTKLELLEELARGYTKSCESAGVAVGDDLDSCIQSNEDGDDMDELCDLLIGEMENVVEYAKAAIVEVKKIRAKKN